MNDYTMAPSAAPVAGDRALRILWVKVGGLWPANSGGRLRSFHLLRELSQKHDISIITTHRADEDPALLVQQLPRCRSVASHLHTSIKRNSPQFLLTLLSSWFSALSVDLYRNRIPAVRRSVAQALANDDYDLCIADFLFAMPNVPLGGKTPVVLFSHNVEYMIWRRLGNIETGLLRRLVLAVEWRKMRLYENWACARADLTVTVSEDDRQLLGPDLPDSKITSIATGVDTVYFKAADPARELATELVFTGSMDWHPNEDAMLYFIGEILPLVRNVMPDATLSIVGRNPSQRLCKVAADATGVMVTGTVDDVRPYVEAAAVFVVPLRIGGGTRLKIYEALAMGKGVVSTTIGAEGLPLEEGVHILRADAPQAFANNIIELLRNTARRQQLGQAGRQLMEQQYSWSRVAGDFDRFCQAAVRT